MSGVVTKRTTDLTEADIIKLKESFYGNPFLMSQSGLKKLTDSPSLFYRHYVMKQREDSSDKSSLEGKLIHTLILEPEKLSEKFELIPELPSDSNKKVLDMLYTHHETLKALGYAKTTLEEYEDSILEILASKEVFLYQALKTDAQRMEKILTDRNKEYWKMRTSEKPIIDEKMLGFAEEAARVFRGNTNLMELIGQISDPLNPVKTENEIDLVAFPDELPFGLRGILDNIVIDPAKKKILVNDLKKSSRNIKEFQESIEFWKYWMQAAMYHMLVTYTYKSNLLYSDYDIEFRFIVIDNYLNMAPIKVSNATMDQWIADTKHELEKAKYHFENRDFTLPYEFLINENNEMVI